MLLRRSLLLILVVLAFRAEGSPPPEFFQCEAAVNAICQSYGAPAKLIPICSQYLQVCPEYPDGPVVNGVISYIYNCLYTDPRYSPPQYNYYAGLVGECAYAATPQDQFKITKTLVDPVTGVQEPVADMVTMSPSVSGCGSLAASSESRVITIQCIDQTTGKPASGCSISINESLAGNNGGHAHGGNRPLGNLSASAGAIPQDGLTITYQSPEAAGDVQLKFTATDPNGKSISVNPTVFHVTIPMALVPISVTGLSVVTDSHPGEGGFGTPALLRAANRLAKMYYADPSIGPSPNGLQSQAVSLPMGGLFDIKQNWTQPHCGHRNGKEIDLSLISNKLSPAEQVALKDAALGAGLHFYVVAESPATPTCISPQTPTSEGCANHWHASLP